MRNIDLRFPLRASRLLIAASALSVAVAGCGSPAPVAGPAASNEQLIFTATTDCVASGKVKQAQCEQALASALNQHLASSTVYKMLAPCEAAEGGAGKCERMDAKAYRPRLVAVAVSVAAAHQAEATNTAVSGAPLYPTLGGEPGFRTLDKKVLLHDNDLIWFSPQAVAAAELNAVTQ